MMNSHSRRSSAQVDRFFANSRFAVVALRKWDRAFFVRVSESFEDAFARQFSIISVSL